jgi:hypothetical protein
MKGIKTNQVTLNLGLGNNPYSMNCDIVELINTTVLNTFETSVRIVEGTYNGEIERTAVINCVTTEDNIKVLTEEVEKLCVIFTQERIPFLLNNAEGVLVDHPFMNLNPMTFNLNYFIK